jgi:cytochrome P450
LQVHVLHRREDLWGADASSFVPERWDGRRPGWEYLPFNGGPRICLGQQFALTEAGYVAVRLLQRYAVLEGRERSGPVKHGLTLINSPADGVKARLLLDGS